MQSEITHQMKEMERNIVKIIMDKLRKNMKKIQII